MLQRIKHLVLYFILLYRVVLYFVLSYCFVLFVLYNILLFFMYCCWQSIVAKVFNRPSLLYTIQYNKIQYKTKQNNTIQYNKLTYKKYTTVRIGILL